MTSNISQREGNAVQQFVANHAEQVIGVLFGLDRLVFRGTLRTPSQRGGLMTYLSVVRVLLVDFAAHALKLT